MAPTGGSTIGSAQPKALAIGVSLGGPEALAALLPQLPRDLGVPIFIVQHMPAVSTAVLASRLAARSQFPVAEAGPHAVVTPGAAWIAPGDFHMVVDRCGVEVCLRTHHGPRETACRPAVDPLFRSVSAVYGSGTVAVVLTGLCHDGLEGSRHVREAGGTVIVQDQASSVSWSMPGRIVKAGLADRVTPLDQIGSEVLSCFGYTAPSVARRSPEVR